MIETAENRNYSIVGRVFISHSSKDADIAKAICHYLEDDGIRCWLAPRDIDSSDWAGCIMRGIHQCDIFVVIVSKHSITSPEVIKEVTEATRTCQYILPFKTDEELLPDRLRYHLAPCHWLDAVIPPLKARIDELISRIRNLAQEDAVYLNHNCQRLVRANIMPKSFFVGRDEELEQIHAMLEEERILFLCGMGGIGKTEIAKAYAKKYESCYDTILFANYRGSILDMVIGDDITIENFKRNMTYGEDAESNEAFFLRKLQTFKNLSTARTLLIIDNFDAEEDPQMEDLMSGPYRLLFTTRYEHCDYACLNVGPIQDFEKVREVFRKNYGRPVQAKDTPTVDAILNTVNCHTITVELIAKQMRASFLSPEKMLEILQTRGINTGLREKIKHGTAGNSAFAFIRELFHLSALSEQEQYVMKCMCMVPFSGIDAERLGQYLELDSFDVINSLISKSWLMLDEYSFRLKMHPIIYDVVKDQLSPDPTGCQAYIRGVWKDFDGAWFMPLEEREEKWPYVDHILRHYGEPTAALWNQYTDFANVAWVCGKFEQSIRAATALYAFTLKTFGSAGFKPCFAARAVAGAYFNAGDDQSAKPYYLQALEHMLQAPEEDYIELGIIYQKVGRCAYSDRDFERSLACLNASLEAFEKAKTHPATKDRMHVNTPGDTYVDFGRLYMAMGDYQTALKYCQQSYDLFYSWKNCEITSNAYSLSDMGICYSYLGEYELAEQYLTRALDLNKRFNGECSMVTMRTREAIADNLFRKGDTQTANSAYMMLELDAEKFFGEGCSFALRMHKKRNSNAA